MVNFIGQPKVLLKDFVGKEIFKLIQENILKIFKDKSLTKKKIEFLPTNQNLAMKTWKFCQKYRFDQEEFF